MGEFHLDQNILELCSSLRTSSSHPPFTHSFTERDLHHGPQISTTSSGTQFFYCNRYFPYAPAYLILSWHFILMEPSPITTGIHAAECEGRGIHNHADCPYFKLMTTNFKWHMHTSIWPNCAFLSPDTSTVSSFVLTLWKCLDLLQEDNRFR